MASKDQKRIITSLNSNLTELISKCNKGNINKNDLTSVIEGNNRKLAELFEPVREISSETELEQVKQTIDPTILSVISYLLENANKNSEREINKVIMLYNEQKEQLEKYREYSQGEFFKLGNKIDKLETEKKELNKRAETAEAKVKVLEQELITSNANIDDLEQNKRNIHIVLNNLPSGSGTNNEVLTTYAKLESNWTMIQQTLSKKIL